MPVEPQNRWLAEAAGRSHTYDRRWDDLAAAGHNVHGEADLIESLGPRTVLDAGCGTGRVAVELARRGLDVTGVDIDPAMLAQARAKAPDLPWVLGDLAALDLRRTFDAIVAAGNVMIFVAPGTEPAVVFRLAAHLDAGGLLIAGFSLNPGGLDVLSYDRYATGAGLDLVERWATWDREPYEADGAYAVSVHRRRSGG